ncbi:MAG: DUF115 domain-containing protein [Treponema sp.]|nr:DUF115 domain-containing protein [Treponema sp.]MCL2272629.1 DUF115 domain-containing protein [Treponema sp.]
MSFFETNKFILQNQYPGLLEEISADSGGNLSAGDFLTETSASGEPALCVKGIYVHSMRDPVREAQRLVQTADTGKDFMVILGFGLGYAAQAAAGQPVVIVEKYKNLLLKAFELRDFSDLLSSNRVIFVIGGSGDGIMNALAVACRLAGNVGEKPSFSVIRNRALYDLDKEWYGAVEEKIRTWSMKDDVNSATFRRFGRRWVRNLSRNISAIRDCPGISRLSSLAGEGVPLPVFLAAAGPSLDRIVPLLRDIYNKCIIVAVDTSLRFFLKNGIEPDFVLVVDPQFWNSRHLDRCIDGNNVPRTVLVAESAVYPPVLNIPFRKTFLCGSMFPFGTFIENRVDPKGVLGAGGSVATTAWDFARSLGAGDIWIAGLDLAFPSLKTHFRGARFEEQANSQSDRFHPVETWVVRALRDGFPFKAPCAGGGRVLTDRRLSLYAAWFENKFSVYNNVRNHFLFPEGLLIAGMQAAETRDFLSLPERRDEINKRIDKILMQIDNEFFDPDETLKRAKRYGNAVSLLKQGLVKIKIAADEGAQITKHSMKRDLNPSQRNKVMNELDDITKRISNSEVKEVASFLFPLAENEDKLSGDPFDNYLNSSFKLFSSLSETVSVNLNYLK